MIKKILIVLSSLVVLIPGLSFGALAWTYDSGGTLSTGLVNYFALEDLTNTAPTGTTTLINYNSSAFSGGKNGNAVDLGNPNTTKSLGTTTFAGMNTNLYSVSFWANFSALTATVQLFEMGDTKVSTGVQYNGGTDLQWRRDKPCVAGQNYGSTQTIATSTWYNIAFVYNGTTLQGYVNGTSSGTGLTASGVGSCANAGFDLGTDARILDSGAAYFPGLIDELATWNKALTTTEIADLYNGGTGSFYEEEAVVATTPKMSVVWFD